MTIPLNKTAWITGEVSPALYGHVDLARMQSAASTMRNAWPKYTGGAYSRAGTMFVGFSKQTGRTFPPRLIPFQFSINQGLALEFGHFYMRVISNGAYVTETPIVITNITRANPAVVSATNTFVNGDWVFISGVNGMTQVNGQTYVIANRTSGSFSLRDVYGNNINSSAFSAYASGGTAARIFTLATIYNERDLKYLKVTQSADVMSICNVNPTIPQEYPPLDLSRFSDTNWTFSVVIPAPSVAPPATASLSASTSGTVDYAYQVTAVADDGSESVASPIAIGTNFVDIASTAGVIKVTWASVPGVNEYNIYKAPPGYGSTPVPPGSLFGFAGSAYGTQFIDGNIVSDFTQVPPTHQNPFARGQILAVTILSGGSGFTQASVGYSISTATGTGFVGIPIIQSGALVGFLIEDPGENYAPADTMTITGSAGVTASGFYNFSSGIPTNGQTIGLNGISWTFVNSGATGNQTNIQASLQATLFQLAADLTNSVAPAISAANYSVAGNVLFITYGTVGTAGNAYTIDAGSYGGLPSGATLTGGLDAGGGGATVALVLGPQTGTYPSVVNYFQERRGYANTLNNPDTYFFSQPGAFTNFDTRTPTIPSDAITGSPWSVQVDGVQWLVATAGGLLVMTGQAAWLLVGAGSFATNVQPLSPSSQAVTPQAFSGCSATIPPIKINYDILFVESKGSLYYDLPYQLYALSEPLDTTENSSHLFVGFTIVEHAWCEQPNKLLWSVRSDGAMLSFTFLKAQQVAGWARHDTDGLFMSVCSVTEPPVDALYLATQRFPGTKTAYMIERMDNRIWKGVENCWCVDAGLQLATPTPNATLTASSASGLGAISGVTNLVGGSGYSAATVATVIDNVIGSNTSSPGSGAVPVLTIAGGVITGVAFSSPGAGYVNPQLSIVDPAGSAGGSGASAKLTLDNSTTFIANGNVFVSGSVGSVIRMGGGIASITSFVGVTQVVANMLSPITKTLTDASGAVAPLPAAPGTWSMTAPVTTVSGLNHLIGATVTGLADGNVIPPTVVDATGSITLATPATAIIVGLGFQAQLQSVYLEAGQPTSQGQRKKVAAVTARLEASRGVKAGSNQIDGSTMSPPLLAPIWNNLTTVPDNGPNFPAKPYNALAMPLRTGDIRVPIGGGWATPGQVAFQQDFPLPMQILSISTDFLPGDTPQNQVQASQGGARGR